MSSALRRGRTLNPEAAEEAKKSMAERRKQLLGKHRLKLSRKERGEARRLTGRWDFWNYKEVDAGLLE